MVPGQTIQIAAHDGAAQGLQTLTMTNANNNAPTTGATIVQYAQGPDGQFLIPGNSELDFFILFSHFYHLFIILCV